MTRKFLEMIAWMLRRFVLLVIVSVGLIMLMIGVARLQSAQMITFIADIDNQTDIYSIDLMTRHPVNVTSSHYPEWSFAWSNTGTLTYTASVNPSQAADELLAMTRLGITQLIDTPDTLYSFGGVWSPDGQTYAYFSSHPRNISDIYTVTLPNFEIRNLTQTETVSETNPLWSPIGTELLYRLDGDLYLIDVTTGESRLLVQLVQLSSASIEDPVWSPDGQWLIFYNREWVQERNQLMAYLVSRDGEQLTRLTNLPSVINSPVTWSPDSTQIALITNQTQLTRYDLTTQTMTHIDGEVRRFAPSWSPDGRYIAFIQNRHLYLYNSQTERIIPLLTEGRVKPPLLWHPR